MLCAVVSHIDMEAEGYRKEAIKGNAIFFYATLSGISGSGSAKTWRKHHEKNPFFWWTETSCQQKTMNFPTLLWETCLGGRYSSLLGDHSPRHLDGNLRRHWNRPKQAISSSQLRETIQDNKDFFVSEFLACG